MSWLLIQYVPSICPDCEKAGHVGLSIDCPICFPKTKYDPNVVNAIQSASPLDVPKTKYVKCKNGRCDKMTLDGGYCLSCYVLVDDIEMLRVVCKEALVELEAYRADVKEFEAPEDVQALDRTISAAKAAIAKTKHFEVVT